MDYIISNFGVTNEEYEKIDELYGDLFHFMSHQLIRGNTKNNHTDEEEDIVQEVRWAAVKAAAYFKRQVYIEKCMKVVRQYIKNKEDLNKLDELETAWLQRTSHGAGKSRYSQPQEEQLDALVHLYIPEEDRPKKDKLLDFNSRFATYVKSVTWNKIRNLGKSYTKMKSLRVGQISLSEYDYLGSPI